MKIKPKIYARVLVDVMMSKKNTGNEKKIVDNFLKLLKKNVDVKNAMEIIRLAEVFILQKTGNKKITLETAREIGRKNIFKEIVRRHDIVEEKINPELIAGIRVTVNGENQLDFSLKNKLDKIFN